MKEQLLNRVKNMVKKGGVNRSEQFLLLSHCFQNAHVFKKPSAAEVSESVYIREKVKEISDFF